MTGVSYVGGIAGQISSSSVSNVTNTGDINATGSQVAGVAGYIASSTLEDATNAATVTGASYVGGIAGQAVSSSVVSNVTNTGDINATGNYVAGITGSLEKSKVVNSENEATIKGVSYVGGISGQVNGAYSTIYSVKNTGALNASGSYIGGIAGYLYQYSSINDASSSGNITMTASGQSYVGGIVGRAYGVNQSYYTSITNVTSSGTIVANNANYVGGIVGDLNYYTNVSKSKSSVVITGANQYVGGIAGNVAGASNRYYTYITESEFSGEISGATRLGGIVGQMNAYSRATNVESSAKITASSNYAGGIAGYVQGGNYYYTTDISNASFSGSVTAANYAGGIAGDLYQYSIIYDSNNTGTVKATSNYAGGIVGYSYGYSTNKEQSNRIYNVYSKGTVTAESYAGGIAGYTYRTYINNAYNSGNVTATTSSAGGIVGLANQYNYINRVSSSGTITSATKVGGIIGETNSDYNYIKDSFSEGAITSTGNYVGGIVGYGYQYLYVDRTYTNAEVSGASYVGGILGGTNNSYIYLNDVAATSSASVTGTGNYVGGIAGYMTSNSQVNYAKVDASVTGVDYVGGLVGQGVSSSYFRYSLVNGSVTGTGTYVGAFAGTHNSTSYVQNNAYNSDVVGVLQQIGGGATGSSTTEVTNSTITDSYFYQNASTTYWNKTEGVATLKLETEEDNVNFVVEQNNFIGEVKRLTEEEALSQGYTIIKTAEDLQNINNNLGGKYILMGDIDLSEYSNWTSIGNSSNYFTGEFNGNGYTIKNLNISTSSSYQGLFGYTKGAIINNVAIEDAKVYAASYVGVLVGCANDTYISNVYTTGSLKYQTSSSYYGGLIGYATTSSVQQSYSDVNVSGYNYTGGLIGYANSTSVSESYATGRIEYGYQYTGGLIGYVCGTSSITNTYATGSVFADYYYAGGLIGYATGSGVTVSNSYASNTVSSNNSYHYAIVGYNSGAEKFTNCYYNADITDFGAYNTSSNTTNVKGLTSAEFSNASSFTGFSSDIWTFTSGGPRFASQVTTAALSDASGFNKTSNISSVQNEEDLLISQGYTFISTAQDLQDIQNALNGKYILTSDIDLTGFNWTSISEFSGELIGNGHTITGLTISKSGTTNVGLFATTNGAVIRDIQLKDVNITGGQYTGALVGQATNQTSISGVTISGSVTSNTNYVGGIVGNLNNSTVVDSTNSATVTGVSYVGGIAGQVYGSGIQYYSSVIGSNNTGAINSSGDYVGGITGYLYQYASISDSTSSGDIKLTSSGKSYVGGITGRAYGVNQYYYASITNSTSSGTITANNANFVGGIVGDLNYYSNASKLNSSTVITGANQYIGGIAGHMQGADPNYKNSITDAKFSGQVTGATFVGGIVGYLNPNSILNSVHNKGTVTSTSQYAGGIVGYSNGYGNQSYCNLISNATSTGTVKSNGNYAGGITGYSSYTRIYDSYSKSNISGNEGIGGIVGLASQYTYVDRTYSSATIEGTTKVGGIFGVTNSNYNYVADSFTEGNIQATGNYVGGIVGYGFQYLYVDRTYTSAVVSGASYVGGILGGTGYNYIYFNNVAATSSASVTGTGNYIGGIAGNMNGESQVNYAKVEAAVRGADYVGGLVGNGNSSAYFTYSLVNAVVRGDGTNAGALAGYHNSSSYMQYNAYNADVVDVTKQNGGGSDGQYTTVVKNNTLSNSSFFQNSPTSCWVKSNGEATLEVSTLKNPVVVSKNLYINDVKQLSEEAAIAQGYTIIKTADDLQNMLSNLSGKYILMNDIDLNDIRWNSIGDSTNAFVGEFNGNGFTIKNLNISKSSTYQGLFGYTDGATISNVAIERANIITSSYSGILIGYANNTTVTNSYTTGQVIDISNSNSIGGLIGQAVNSNITTSYSDAYVEGYNYTGGLIGYIQDTNVSESYSTGFVASEYRYTGGLIGYACGNSTIKNTYATGQVWANEYYVGGLVGYMTDNTVLASSYASNFVSLNSSYHYSIAYATGSAIIQNCYYNTYSSQASSHSGNAINVSALSPYEICVSTLFNGWSTDVWAFTANGPQFLSQVTISDLSSDSAFDIVRNVTQADSYEPPSENPSEIVETPEEDTINSLGYVIGIKIQGSNANLTGDEVLVGGSVKIADGALINTNGKTINEVIELINSQNISGVTASIQDGKFTIISEYDDNIIVDARDDFARVSGLGTYVVGSSNNVTEASDIEFYRYQSNVSSLTGDEKVISGSIKVGSGSVIDVQGLTLNEVVDAINAQGQSGITAAILDNKFIIDSSLEIEVVATGDLARITGFARYTAGAATIEETDPMESIRITEEEAIEQGYTVIKTAAELQAMNNNLSGKYILMSDIDLSGVTWVTIGNSSSYFTGEFNGNGYTINNLSLSSSSNYQGLFGMTNGATIKNIHIDAANVKGGQFTGTLVGYAQNSYISNVAITNTKVEGTNSYTGGIVGYIYRTVASETADIDSSCFINSTITSSSSYTGGIAGGFQSSGTGNSSAKIYNSLVDANISGGDHVAGIVGYSPDYGIVRGCSVAGSVTGRSYVAGVLSFVDDYAYVEQNYVSATIKGTGNYSGGITAYVDDYNYIQYNYFDGAMTSTGSHIGSITGFYYSSYIQYNYSTENRSVYYSHSGSGSCSYNNTGGSVASSYFYSNCSTSYWDKSGSKPVLKNLPSSSYYLTTSSVSVNNLADSAFAGQTKGKLTFSDSTEIVISSKDSRTDILQKISDAGYDVSINDDGYIQINGIGHIVSDSSGFAQFYGLLETDSSIESSLYNEKVHHYTAFVNGSVSTSGMSDIAFNGQKDGEITFSNGVVVSVSATDTRSQVLEKINSTGLSATINSNGNIIITSKELLFNNILSVVSDTSGFSQFYGLLDNESVYQSFGAKENIVIGTVQLMPEFDYTPDDEIQGLAVEINISATSGYTNWEYLVGFKYGDMIGSLENLGLSDTGYDEGTYEIKTDNGNTYSFEVTSSDTLATILEKINVSDYYRALLTKDGRLKVSLKAVVEGFTPDNYNLSITKNTDMTSNDFLVRTGITEFEAGNNMELFLGLSQGQYITGNVTGLNPSNVLSGLTAGTFVISSVNNSAQIDILATDTLQNIMDKINATGTYKAVINLDGSLTIGMETEDEDNLSLSGTSNFASLVGMGNVNVADKSTQALGKLEIYSTLRGSNDITADMVLSGGNFIIALGKQEVTFKVLSTDTIADVIDKINNSELDLTASIDNGRLLLKADNPNANAIVIKDGSSDFAEKTGIVIAAEMADTFVDGLSSSLTSALTAAKAQITGYTEGSFFVNLTDMTGKITESAKITIDANESIDSIIKKINESGLAITATLNSAGKMVLTRGNTAEAGGISVSSGSSTFTASIGFTEGGSQCVYAEAGVLASVTSKASIAADQTFSSGNFTILLEGNNADAINITINTGDTISDIIDKINRHDGVSASLNDKNQLVISRNSGDGLGSIQILNGSSNFTFQAGFTSGGEQSVNQNLGKSAVAIAENAVSSKTTFSVGTFEIKLVGENAKSTYITIDDGDKLSDVIAKINNSSAGVHAYLNEDGKLVIARDINNGTGGIEIHKGSSDFTNILGYTTGGEQLIDSTLGKEATIVSDVSISFNKRFTEGTFYIVLNGDISSNVAITISATDSILDIIDSINQSGAGVTASLNSSNKLVITRNADMGAGNITIKKGTSNFTTQLGFTKDSDIDMNNYVTGTSSSMTSLNTVENAQTTGYKSGNFYIQMYDANGALGQKIEVLIGTTGANGTADSVATIVNTINSLDAGIKASIIGGKLILTRSETLAAGTFTVTKGTSDFTSVIGLTDGGQSCSVLDLGSGSTSSSLTSTTLDKLIASEDIALSSIGVTAGTFRINGADIIVRETDTLSDLINRINAVFSDSKYDGCRVFAAYVNGEIVLKTQEVSSNASLYVESGTTNFTTIANLTTQSTINEANLEKGQNAKFSINGKEYDMAAELKDADSPNNVIYLDKNGEVITDREKAVTILELKSIGKTEISVGANLVSDCVEKLQDFVTKFNTAMKASNNSLLYDDMEFQIFKSNLQQAFESSVGDEYDVISALRTIGIDVNVVGGLVNTVTLSLTNEGEKYIDAIYRNPSKVLGLLVGDDSADADYQDAGVLTRVSDILHTNTQSAKNGYFKSTINSISAQQKALKKEIQSETFELNDLMREYGGDATSDQTTAIIESLSKQYALIVQAIEQLSNQYASLSSMSTSSSSGASGFNAFKIR